MRVDLEKKKKISIFLVLKKALEVRLDRKVSSLNLSENISYTVKFKFLRVREFIHHDISQTRYSIPLLVLGIRLILTSILASKWPQRQKDQKSTITKLFYFL